MGEDQNEIGRRLNCVLPKQKAALTRAVRSGDREKVKQVCREAVRAWDEIGGWPDDWSRWQRALDDAFWRHGVPPLLDELRR